MGAEATGTDVLLRVQGLCQSLRQVHTHCGLSGRYSLIADNGELAGRFEFDGDRVKFEPTYSVAPTQEVLTVVGGDVRRGGFMR